MGQVSLQAVAILWVDIKNIPEVPNPLAGAKRRGGKLSFAPDSPVWKWLLFFIVNWFKTNSKICFCLHRTLLTVRV